VEDTATVTVGPDGTVTGAVRVIHDRSEVVTQKFTMYFHNDLAGELSGKLTSSEGLVHIYLLRSGTITHLDGTTSQWADPPSDWVVSIRMVDGVMTGEVIGLEGSEDVFFTFAADRQ